jgi:tRNA(fMet)-specific endonuclease VapC
LSEADRQLFQQFLQRIEIVGLSANDPQAIEQIVQIRQQYRVKLPDAIIAGTAIMAGASLVTADQELAKVPSLTILRW